MADEGHPLTEKRFHAIDRLRALMIMAVIVGHAMLPYVTVPRSFKDASTHVGFDVAAVFIYSFAMQVFFVTAGFAAAMFLDRRGTAALVRNRLTRIFLPLIVAYLVLSPLTRGAYDFAKAAVAAGTIQAGIDVVLSGEWIRWSKLYHLWFLVSLLLFSTIALIMRYAVTRIGSRWSDGALLRLRRLLLSTWRPVPLVLLIGVATVPAYVVSAGESTTALLQFSLLVYFLLGWLLYLLRDDLTALARYAGHYLLLAVAVLPATVWATRLRLMSPEAPQLLVGLVAGLGNSVLGACMTFGLLGLVVARESAPSVKGRYLSDASYWLYLIHLPVVVATGGAVSVLSLPALAKYLLTVAIALPLVFATYHVIGRRRPARNRRHSASAR